MVNKELIFHLLPTDVLDISGCDELVATLVVGRGDDMLGGWRATLDAGLVAEG